MKFIKRIKFFNFSTVKIAQINLIFKNIGIFMVSILYQLYYTYTNTVKYRIYYIPIFFRKYDILCYFLLFIQETCRLKHKIIKRMIFNFSIK